MDRFARRLFRFICTILGILLIFTAVLVGVAAYFSIDFDKANLDELAECRSVDDLKDWYYGEVGTIVVGEPVVVESISYDRYAYQQLDETTRQVYDQILDCILNYEEKVSLVSKSTDVLSRAYEAVMADYGNLFWVSGYQYNTYKSGEEIVGLEFAPKYTMSQEQRDVYNGTIKAVAQQWLEDLPADATDYEKALFVFETLINNVDYDSNSIENQNILSVFIHKSTVCQGYADAAWYLLNELGIESTVITGEANNEPHAWNLVYLDNAYYFMDVTWGNSKYLNLDNSTAKRVNYAYLAMTTEELSLTHTINVGFEVPECLSTADNYYVHEGLYFDNYDVNSIGWTMQKSYEAGDAELSVKFANSEIYQQVISYFFDEQHISEYCNGITSIYYILDDNANVLTIQW